MGCRLRRYFLSVIVDLQSLAFMAPIQIQLHLHIHRWVWGTQRRNEAQTRSLLFLPEKRKKIFVSFFSTSTTSTIKRNISTSNAKLILTIDAVSGESTQAILKQCSFVYTNNFALNKKANTHSHICVYDTINMEIAHTATRTYIQVRINVPHAHEEW